MHGSFARALSGEVEPGPGEGRLSGGSPRYRIYETADGRFLSVAPLEEKFWRTFCATIGLDAERIAELGEGADLISEIAAILGRKTCAEWMALFQGKDVCVEPVRGVKEVLNDAHFNTRAVFEQKLETVADGTFAALPVPLAKDLRRC
ncbi:hypothetical protein A3731_32280 [Roseovarius sp. HI0049]|nr:hypothetical protein A3731_32280 [Roseovarius sp. HI0049]